jgi:hypothetical protein
MIKVTRSSSMAHHSADGMLFALAWFSLVTSALFVGLSVLGWKTLPAAISTTVRSWMLVVGSLLHFPGIPLVL